MPLFKNVVTRVMSIFLPPINNYTNIKGNELIIKLITYNDYTRKFIYFLFLIVVILR